MSIEHRIDDIIASPPADSAIEKTIGRSREGRPIKASLFGTGTKRLSLLAGCHADEPVGPRLLKHLCSYLSELPQSDPMLSEYEWWIIPHINPDGEIRNEAWQKPDVDRYDLVPYLQNRVRELPGDDIEFGFPGNESDKHSRPENQAAFHWWKTAKSPFSMHISLHGMSFAAGPWFLLEEAWKDRASELKERCAARVAELGYTLHDVERNGEKGFFRLGRGFCTRPDSRYMSAHFTALGDESTASLFRPSSMETIRSLGGDPLTLVSEMPLFLTPGVGEELGPPDPIAVRWKERIAEWSKRLEIATDEVDAIRTEAEAEGLQPMDVIDQMRLQWTFIAAGIEQVGI
ncbi:MAG: M14 family zinc carboxypeptidase [Myxococcota bacterium]|nr:M14 family zinc carboxypeptidase [Myxococcota bacterium]